MNAVGYHLYQQNPDAMPVPTAKTWQTALPWYKEILKLDRSDQRADPIAMMKYLEEVKGQLPHLQRCSSAYAFNDPNREAATTENMVELCETIW